MRKTIPATRKRPHRSRATLLVAALALVPLAVGRSEPSRPSEKQGQVDLAQRATPLLALEPVAEGLTAPLNVVDPADSSGRLFIVQQGGEILIHDGSRVLEQPFLDLSSQVSCCDERGLLGLAFHPRYSENGRFFVNYTGRSLGQTVVSSFEVSSDPNVADSSSELQLLTISQPFSNHNGGHLAFGPDGFLYIGTGDGGSGGDPGNRAQNLGSLLGKMLRIDVDRGEPFAIPDDNPFVGDPEAREEIWAYGLRNPWRFTFDRRTGDLFIGDVGQDAIEEIDFQPARSSGGENYGWRVMEGSQCFEPPSGCNAAGLVLPIAEYNHSQGCSVTGGFRYRGPKSPTLDGFYLLGDFCSGRIWGARADRRGRWRLRQFLTSDLAISSFGEDASGNLYVVDYRGSVFRLVGRPIFASDFESGSTADWSRQRGVLAITEPGLGGTNQALELVVDGTDQALFLQSSEPQKERTFRAAFLLRANRVDLGGGSVEILRLRKGRRDHVRLTLEQQGKRYFVGLFVRENQGGFRSFGRTRVPSNRAVLLEVNFLAARTAGGSDGEVTLSKKNRIRVRAPDLQNGRLFVGSVRIGLPAGSAGAIEGSFLLDEYESSP
ncbi:MAG: PQQ-dependent sugar dehydrogenase [Thermoanaerobaculia bacterium]